MKKLLITIILVAISVAAPKYRKIILENELKVILVSDAQYNKSAASMNVLAGSLSDPKEYQGLAHFLEHMLFLGTEKFPDVEGYSSYLQSNGGYSNAYTEEDHTNYHYEVYHDAFEGALDRFSQFFISPLFSAKYTEREMNAVNSEYQKNLEQDYWRMRQVKRNLYNPEHPANHFEIGTLETLSKVDRRVLLDFHKKYYSANMMSLSIMSNLELDELERLARQYFSDVKNHNTQKIEYPQNYLEEKEALRLLKVVPIKDVKRLILEFPTPAFYDAYLTKPEKLLLYLIGHEGEGSLVALLKSQGLATGIGVWGSSATYDYGSLNIWVELTSEGFDRYEDVLTACFSYIEMLKEFGYQSFIYEESKVLAELEEKYSDKGEGVGVALEMAKNLAFYPMEDAERVKFLYGDENPELYTEFLSYIRPNNMLATLSGQGIETTEVEKWYSAKYSYTEINDDFYKSLSSPEKFDELKMPSANQFMPTSTDIKQIKNNSENAEILKDAKGIKLYHSRDLEFNRPKASLIYKVRFPQNIVSLNNAVLMDLYIASVNETLNEVAYPAYLAGMQFSITNDSEGILISVDGYDSALSLLMDRIIDALNNITLDEKRFSVIMDSQVRGLENKSLDAAYKIARREVAGITKKIFYSPEEKRSIIESFSLGDVKNFPKTIYKGVYLQGLAHGNISKKKALSISTKLRNALGYRSISESKFYSQQRVKLNPGEKIVNQIESKVNNSSYVAMFDIGGNSPKDRVMAMMIDTFIGQPYNMELRTNQQLGYIVAGGAYARDDYSGMYFIIQSDGYGADVVEDRSLKFLSEISILLDEITDEEFGTFKSAVREQITEKSTSITEEAKRRFNRAFELDNNHERDTISLSALDEMTIGDMKSTLLNVVGNNTSQSVTVLLYANEHEISTEKKSSFEDLHEWKKTRIFQ
ncbi:MAG: insulinase family protein [Candidatus Marinimicrobia bacterium]|nr:insulinase family protein [Candidatus Neomarinimicrobiota bacterium]